MLVTQLLLRVFVGNIADPQEPAVRSAIGKLSGAAGIFCNLLLFGGKLLAGLLAGSVSIIADALNNLSDAASAIMTLLGFNLAERPADVHHPYGHARFEYLSALAVAVMILVMIFPQTWLLRWGIGAVLGVWELIQIRKRRGLL